MPEEYPSAGSTSAGQPVSESSEQPRVESQIQQEQGQSSLPKEWHVGKDGQRHGPFDQSQVIAGMQSGQFRPTDLCWKKGMATWAPLGSVATFAAAVPTPVAASPTGSQAAQVVRASEQIQAGVQKAREAALGAFAALKILARDPVGGLPAAYQGIGKGAALWSGIVYLVVYEILGILCVSFALWRLSRIGRGMFELPASAVLRALVATSVTLAVFFVGMWLSLMAIRMISRAEETFHADVFVASFAALAYGLSTLLCLLIVFKSPEIGIAIGILGVVYAVLLLFSCVSRLYHVVESRAAWCVTAIFLVASWLTLVIVRLMISMMAERAGFSAFSSPFM